MSAVARTVRAAVCRGIGSALRVEELELAGPSNGEVLVRTRACSVCHSDIAFTQGKWGDVEPTVYGHEIAGVVEESGPGVDLRAGEHVLVSLIRSCGHCTACRAQQSVLCRTTFALDRESPLSSEASGRIGHGLRCGGFAEYVTVHASQVVRIPQDVPFSAASVVACAGITGIGAVTNTADVPHGQNVVVIGVGGVGINSLQGAALRDPASLIAIDVSEAKLTTARRFGASHSFPATGPEAVGAVRDATDGKGADFVFVTVGAPAAVRQALDMVARGGTVVLVGMPATGASVSIEPATIAADEIRILGSKMGSTDLARDVPRILQWYRDGRIKLEELVTDTFALDDINDAFAAAQHPDIFRVAIEFPPA